MTYPDTQSNCWKQDTNENSCKLMDIQITSLKTLQDAAILIMEFN